MIAPTVGRVVWYWPNNPGCGLGIDEVQPMAATVAYVHNDRKVNLSVVNHHGERFASLDVLLLQGDETFKPVGKYCAWMPYQIGKAANAAAPQP